MKRLTLVAVLVTALLAAGAATAIATPHGVFGATHATQATGPTMGNVGVKYTVTKFVKKGNTLIAKGIATATYTPKAGAPTVVKKAFTAKVTVAKRFVQQQVGSQQRICQVLTLTLGPLHLNLLGLIVDLNQVNLTITADSEGGILGSLLCALSGQRATMAKLASASTAHKLTRAAHRSGLATKGIGFAVPTRQAQAQQPGPCQVLDLVLGPLHLNLLGLIVDLNQVHLQITADPNGGILGSLLCALSGGPTTTAGASP
jgi:hypothetical protein